MFFFNTLNTLNSLRSFNKYNIGYALSGGGSRGFAHLGVIKALEERRIKPDIIAGTSSGALAGVLYADGFTTDEIADMFKKTKFKQFVELMFPTTGLFKPTGLHQFLKSNLRARTFEQLNVPFIAVATDWKKGITVNLSEGDKLIESVVASCCVPLIFSPVNIDGQEYVDGGIFKNLPVSTIREQCNVLFGINVTIKMPPEEKHNLKYVAERTFNLMSISNTLADKKLCDVLIEVIGIEKHWMFDLSNMDLIIETGYECAVNKLKERKATNAIIKSKRLELLNFKIQDDSK
ncbi:MAG: patatin-like phospholipase family protein [Candidatus Saccharimonadaceae bacterium]